MLTIKHSVAIIAIPFSLLSTASNLTSQLHNFFGTQLTGVGDKARVSIHMAPDPLPPCDQPLLSISDSSHPRGNINVLAYCDNDKRYLRVSVQVTGDYVVAVMPVVRGGKLEAGSVRLKRGRLDTLSLCTMLDINQLADVVSLHGLSPDQPIQLTQSRQARWVKVGRRVNMIASGDKFNANAEGQALNNVTVTQNAWMRMIPG